MNAKALLFIVPIIGGTRGACAPLAPALPDGRYIGRSMEVLHDAAAVPIGDALIATGFMPVNEDVPNLGLGKQAHWLRFMVDLQPQDQPVVLSIGQPDIDRIEVFAVGQTGWYSKVGDTGLDVPGDARVQRGPEFSFALPADEGPLMVYIRVQSSKQLQFPVTLSTAQAYTQGKLLRNLLLGGYFGIMLVMALYNFFIFLSTRSRSYLLYTLYILSVSVTQAAFNGAGPFYFWPGSPWFATRATVLLTIATAVLAAEFMINFIGTRTNVPGMHRGVRLFYPLIALCVILDIVGLQILAYKATQLFSAVFAVYLIVVVVRVWLLGSRQAAYFLLAWSGFLLGTTLFVMKDLGLLPYNGLTVHAMPIGSAIEGVLLSFALADRINILRREKERSQAEALATAQENARIVRDQNTMLEMKVTERTEQLQHSLDQLKRTQSKLVEAERMSSLGQLTAGIAHEINNPVNYIRSNIPPLKRDMDDILQVLGSYRSHGTPSPVAELERSLGLDETIDEVRAILRSIEEGADRTAEIVRGLRSFSRLDEDALKTADVDEGLRSTLNILRPQMKEGVDVELDLRAPEPVECYPGKLNQVFMNVLANAIQAVAARHGAKGGRIRVTAGQGECHTVVTVADNGTGMAPEVRARIFEPFFTTKNVGEGTGLGLSIAHSIVEMHNGRIEVESTEGEGTVFRIVLPNTQPMATAKRA